MSQNEPGPGGTRPLTTIQRQQGYVIVIVFVVWFPVYLVWGRPLVLEWVSQYSPTFPIILHTIPAIGVPLLAALLFEKLAARHGRSDE